MENNNTTKKTALENYNLISNIIIGLGFFLIMLSIFIISYSRFTDFEVTPTTILLIFDGAVFTACGIIIKSRISNFEQYSDIIKKQNINSIDQIAKGVNKTPERVKNELERMIRSKYFVDAYINENNCIVFKNMDNNTGIDSSKPNSETEIIVCKNCGAENEVPLGKECNCEYCGSPLNK